MGHLNMCALKVATTKPVSTQNLVVPCYVCSMWVLGGIFVTAQGKFAVLVCLGFFVLFISSVSCEILIFSIALPSGCGHGEASSWTCFPRSGGYQCCCCLDAVHTRYLTNGQPSVERFPISFKTHFSGNYFHHVVLGIYCNGRYGSLGMSRRSDLMDKPLTYRTLSDLIFDFEDSYKKYLHSVKKVKIGLYVPHEPHSFQPIEWKQLVLNVSKMMRTEVRKELEKFARDMRMKILKPSSAHSPMKERSRGKSLSPRRRQASPQRRACKRDKSPAVVDKKGDLATLNEVGYQLRI
ncbi:tubulinyl-Tyr carboxypeptidase 2 isoform X2 [Columba livia]|uniref:tubulinyl-Tyr carboxypeptidase 2 isoform X2 n=1 Tax=Columba livia TaxID=8932 RepID=UPI0031BB1EFE